MQMEQPAAKVRILAWGLAVEQAATEMAAYGNARGYTWTPPYMSLDSYNDREP